MPRLHHWQLHHRQHFPPLPRRICFQRRRDRSNHTSGRVHGTGFKDIRTFMTKVLAAHAQEQERAAETGGTPWRTSSATRPWNNCRTSVKEWRQDLETSERKCRTSMPVDWLTAEQNSKIKTELETFKETLISEQLPIPIRESKVQCRDGSMQALEADPQIALIVSRSIPRRKQGLPKPRSRSHLRESPGPSGMRVGRRGGIQIRWRGSCFRLQASILGSGLDC